MASIGRIGYGGLANVANSLLTGLTPSNLSQIVFISNIIVITQQFLSRPCLVHKALKVLLIPRCST